MTGSPPMASILIPTWDAASTLALAVDSARQQTVTDIEIVIVGDGVTSQVRAVVDELLPLDERIRFLDLPKAPGRGERNRHEGVLACRSDLVVYLADDDLLLPWHVENVAEAFRTHDFVQSLNSYIDPSGELRLWPTDLADPAWRAWHLQEPPRNRVSITGTAHSRALYATLEPGWCEPPKGSWADLTLWQQFFRRGDLNAVTLRDISVLQFPAPMRAGRSEEEVAAEYARWHQFVCSPDARARLEALQRGAELAELTLLSAAVAEVELERDRLAAEVRALRATISWRLTAPLRALRAGLRRRR